MPGIATLNCYVVLVPNVLTDLYLLHIPILVRSNPFPPFPLLLNLLRSD